MEDKAVLEQIFCEFASPENMSIKKSGDTIKYTLKTNFKMTVYIEYDTDANVFSVTLNYPNRDSYELSSYNFYKEYDKKKTHKKLFGKKTFTDHLNTIATYLHENLDVLYEEDTAKVYFGSKIRGYGKLFVE